MLLHDLIYTCAEVIYSCVLFTLQDVILRVYNSLTLATLLNTNLI